MKYTPIHSLSQYILTSSGHAVMNIVCLCLFMFACSDDLLSLFVVMLVVLLCFAAPSGAAGCAIGFPLHDVYREMWSVPAQKQPGREMSCSTGHHRYTISSLFRDTLACSASFSRLGIGPRHCKTMDLAFNDPLIQQTVRMMRLMRDDSVCS